MISRIHNRMRQRKAIVNIALATALLGLPLLAMQSANAQTYTVLHYFNNADGMAPQGPLIEGPDHMLYGATNKGGAYLFGVVYKMSLTGKETILHNFQYWNGFDANGGLVQDAAGNLYGSTYQGGNNGYTGLIYKLNKSGNQETVLHQLGLGTDGASPRSGLVADANGNLYGVTPNGGTLGGGTIFKVDSTGHETVLHNFTGMADGSIPNGRLVFGPDGNLYGTTECGDIACYTQGAGRVFKVDTAGNLTVLYSFSGGADGGTPTGALTFDAQGNIYGTAFFGGILSCGDYGYGCGVVFKLTPSGTETILYTFLGGSDGWNPNAGVILDAAGNMYGATLSDGTGVSCGVVFKLNPQGQETVLHSFTGPDGCTPGSELLLSNNALYGVTSEGGRPYYGVVFKITLK